LCITVWIAIGTLLAKTVTIRAVNHAADQLSGREGGAYCDREFATLASEGPYQLSGGILAGKPCLPHGGDHASRLDRRKTPAALCAVLAAIGRREQLPCN